MDDPIVIEEPEGRGILLESARGIDYNWNDKYNKILSIKNGVIETTFTYDNGMIIEALNGEFKTTVTYNEAKDKVIEKRLYNKGVLIGFGKIEWDNDLKTKTSTYVVNEDGSNYLKQVDSIYISGGSANRTYYEFDESGNQVSTWSEYDVSYDNMKNPHATLPLAYQVYNYGSKVHSNNLVKRSLFYAHDNSVHYTNYHQYNSFKYPTEVAASRFDDDPDTKDSGEKYYFYYITR